MVIRVVATADNHLNRFYARLSPQKLSERRKYLRDGFRAVVDAALAWPAHLFLIGGDLFDTNDPRNLERSFVAQCLADLRTAGIVICAVGGNHDTPRQSTEQGGNTPLDVYRRLGAITYFDDSHAIESFTLTIDGIRLAIGGFTPDPNWEAGFDPLSVLQWHARQDGAETSILLSHGQIEGYTLPRHDGTVFTKDTLRTATDADVVVLGDIHHARTIAFAEGRMVVIPGATERMDFGDQADVPGYSRLEYTAGRGWQAERIALVGQPREVVSIRATELPESDITDYVIQRVLAVADAHTLVKLVLEGIMPRAQYQALNLRTVLDTLNSRIFQCVADTQQLFIEDAGMFTVQRGVRLSQPDEINAYAAELLAATSDATEAALIREALARLIEVL